MDIEKVDNMNSKPINQNRMIISAIFVCLTFISWYFPLIFYDFFYVSMSAGLIHNLWDYQKIILILLGIHCLFFIVSTILYKRLQFDDENQKNGIKEECVNLISDFSMFAGITLIISSLCIIFYSLNLYPPQDYLIAIPISIIGFIIILTHFFIEKFPCRIKGVIDDFNKRKRTDWDSKLRKILVENLRLMLIIQGGLNLLHWKHRYYTRFSFVLSFRWFLMLW